MTKNHSIGSEGEDAALAYLQGKGYKFHGRNVRLGHDEIDLVMFDPIDQAIVFAEVKSRSRFDPDFPPEANLTHAKKQKMFRAGKKWVAQKSYEGSWRLDLLCVIGNRVSDHLIQITTA